MGQADLAELNAIYREFEATALDELQAEGVTEDRVRLERTLDMRYKGQSWKLSVPVPAGDLSDGDLPRIKHTFDLQHEQSFGYCVPDEPAEIVDVGLSAVGVIAKPRLEEVESGGRSPADARKSARPVYFAESGSFVASAIFERSALRQGNVVAGPAVIEELDSSVVVHPGFEAEMARYGILLFRRAG